MSLPSLWGEENVVVSLAELSQLYLQLGWAYELSSQFAQAESIYEELLTLARALHEPVLECAALNRLATQAAQNSQNLARAEELLQQALAIAESSQNKAGVAENGMESRADGILCCQDVSIASACRAGTGTGASIEPAGPHRAEPACARDP